MRFLKSSLKIQNVPTVANQQPSAALNVANSGTVREIASYANGKNISRCVPYSRWVQRKKNRKPIIQKSVRKSKQRKKNLWSKNFELRQLLRSKLQIQCFSLYISGRVSSIDRLSRISYLSCSRSSIGSLRISLWRAVLDCTWYSGTRIHPFAPHFGFRQ